MSTPRLVVIHGAGEQTPEGSSSWLEHIVRSMRRCEYDVSVEDLAERFVTPKYATELLADLERPAVDPSERQVRRVPSPPSERADFTNRQTRLAQGLPPPYPDSLASGMLSLAAKNPTLVQKAAKMRVADAELYLKSNHRRERIRRLVLDRMPMDRPFVLVAHSLGTVVALDALTHLPDSAECRAFVTLGSPLGLAGFLEPLGEQLDRFPHAVVDTWLNVYDADDPVTGGTGLEAVLGKDDGHTLVVDHQVENGGINDRHGLGRYLEQVVVGQHLGRLLAPSERPKRPADPDPVRAGEWLDAALAAGVRRNVRKRGGDPRRRARMAVASAYADFAAAATLGTSPDADLAARSMMPLQPTRSTGP